MRLESKDRRETEEEYPGRIEKTIEGMDTDNVHRYVVIMSLYVLLYLW